MKLFRRALFIFRRDLRLEDNTGLIFALEQAEQVIAAFIFTPEQLSQNPYRGDHCVQFMLESLEDLEESLKAKGGKLYLFFDHPEQVVETCLEKLKIDAVIVNRDYTPYSRKRDEKIEKRCKKRGVPFHSFEDALLHPIQETCKTDGSPYTIFTPFYRKASCLEVTEPVQNPYTNYYKGSIPFAADKRLYQEILPLRGMQAKGGRVAALKILKNLSRFSSYAELRDFPACDTTTRLSPHLKFTTCSVREIHQAIVEQLGAASELIRSLYWRDFFTSIAFFFPHVFEGSFRPKFDALPWSYDKKAFKRWCEGQTGFPLVDAGMREMNQTGFMHNRVRLVAASFLVKDLHIDWRWGEKYFAEQLIDYDPAVNNGNWQWVASTGCDSQPYFRIFNPWNQQIKFDPDCVYIKHWIPELRTLSSKEIHSPNRLASEYPAPMLDHSLEAPKALSAYKNCL